MHYKTLKVSYNIYSYIIFVFCLLGQTVNAQQSTKIEGRVLDQNNHPLAYVHISTFANKTGTYTDDNGYFSIVGLNRDKHTITASIIGFESKSIKVDLRTTSDQYVEIILRESSEQLEEVVLSGTLKEVSKLESPVPIEVYSVKFFKSNPTPSIFESLTTINGVRPQLNCNICNTGDIHINGLEGPYTMVLIDGMPIVSGLSTVYGLTGIPQSLIERVEIVKGPASTLYGSEAVGGLINIITKKPATSPIVSTDFMGTSWGEFNTDIGLRYQLNESQALMGINYFNYQNPIDNNSDGFTDITLQHRISLFNKIDFKRKSLKTFSFASRYVYEDRWGGEMNWNKAYRGGDQIYGESIYTSRWELLGNYELPFDEHIQLQFSANGHNQNSVYGTTNYQANQLIGFSQLSWNHISKRHDFMLGLAYRYTFYDDNTVVTSATNLDNKPSIIHLPGLFIQDEIQFDEQNILLVGLRYDYNSLHKGIISPRLNYKWNSLDQKNIIRLSIGNGYRVANVFTEDHAALTGAREVIFTEELKPETSWNVNLNLVNKFYSSKGIYVGLDSSLFYTHFNNAIFPDYETNPNQIIYENLNGYAVSKGISANLDVVFTNGIKLLAGGTLMDVSITEGEQSYRQLLTERFSGVWSLSYTFASNLKIDYTANVNGPMKLPLLGPLDERPGYSKWYSLQNIQFSKPFKKWELYTGVKNLLNFTPPANSIARAFDPFDKEVEFDNSGQIIPTPNNPKALSFDPTYIYAPNQGIRLFAGIRYQLNR